MNMMESLSPHNYIVTCIITISNARSYMYLLVWNGVLWSIHGMKIFSERHLMEFTRLVCIHVNCQTVVSTCGVVEYSCASRETLLQ